MNGDNGVLLITVKPGLLPEEIENGRTFGTSVKVPVIYTSDSSRGNKKLDAIRKTLKAHQLVDKSLIIFCASEGLPEWIHLLKDDFEIAEGKLAGILPSWYEQAQEDICTFFGTDQLEVEPYLLIRRPPPADISPATGPLTPSKGRDFLLNLSPRIRNLIILTVLFTIVVISLMSYRYYVQQRPLRVAIDSWPGNFAIYAGGNTKLPAVSHSESIFLSDKRQKVRVILEHDPVTRLEKLAGGEVDIVSITLDQVLRLYDGDQRLVPIMASSFSFGGHAILPSSEHLNDIVGSTEDRSPIDISPARSPAMILTSMPTFSDLLGSTKLHPVEIEFPVRSIGDVDKDVDLWLMEEPFLSHHLKAHPYWRPYISSLKAPYNINYLFVTTEDKFPFLSRRLEIFVADWFLAVDRIKRPIRHNNDIETLAVAESAIGIDQMTVRKSLDTTVLMLSYEDNLRFFSTRNSSLPTNIFKLCDDLELILNIDSHCNKFVDSRGTRNFLMLVRKHIDSAENGSRGLRYRSREDRVMKISFRIDKLIDGATEIVEQYESGGVVTSSESTLEWLKTMAPIFNAALDSDINLRLCIIGHADPPRRPSRQVSEINRIKSWHRALALRDMLKQNGLYNQRVSVFAAGDRIPPPANALYSARRSELYISQDGKCEDPLEN